MASLQGMNSKDFELLRELIRERTGLQLGPEGSRQLERRLRERVEALGLSGFGEYHRLLRFQTDGDDELQHVYEAATNSETYFFREDYQLQGFRDEVIPSLAADLQAHRRVTCWSLGCSTGEEPYSIAMVLLESTLLEGWTIRVYGSDLSRQRLAVARRGVYGESSFRSTSVDRRARFFEQEGESFRVRRTVRGMCTFGFVNLITLHERPKYEQPDAVFCRNVLIYFEPEARRRVIDAVFDLLKPGGYLLLGHAESLLHDTTRFVPVHLERDVVYRKPRATSSPPRGVHRRGRHR
jgi:chemotaxis protein methyltransferase CheR